MVQKIKTMSYYEKKSAQDEFLVLNRFSRMQFPCYTGNSENISDIFAFPGSRTYARNNPNPYARLTICISGSLTHMRAHTYPGSMNGSRA